MKLSKASLRSTTGLRDRGNGEGPKEGKSLNRPHEGAGGLYKQ